MNALLARTCRNYAGKVRVKPSYKGVLSQVIPQARQVFERVPAAAATGGGGGAPVTGVLQRAPHATVGFDEAFCWRF